MQLDTTTLVTLIGLFIVLSPGLLLTLPALNQDNIDNLGVAYLNGSNAAVDCTSGTTTEPECKKPRDIWVSGYTSTAAVIVHSIVFAAVLMLLPYFNLPRFETGQTITLAILFGILSPGLILTLPPLSQTDCGQGGKNIADDEEGLKFCAGTDGYTTPTTFDSNQPNCKKCTSVFRSEETSVPAVFVHSLVFAVVAYYIAQNYF